MIYLIDESLTENSHSKYILDIIKNHTDTEVKIIELPSNPTVGQINNIIYNLFDKVFPWDIVLCPWAIDGNYTVDQLFEDLTKLCWVVVAAGNYNRSIHEFSPARAKNVITVACLNKSGIKATLSNYSKDKELVWVPGTNYNLGWKNSSGTSVSAAVYAAFLAESIKYKDPNLLNELLLQHKIKVLDELHKKTNT